VPARPEIRSVFPEAPAFRVKLVLLETASCPMVSMGTAVAVTVPPVSNRRMSFVAGTVRGGVQLALEVQEALAPPAQL
jgi:hypothetical protein